jgi:hypothetical protein
MRLRLPPRAASGHPAPAVLLTADQNLIELSSARGKPSTSRRASARRCVVPRVTGKRLMYVFKVVRGGPRGAFGLSSVQIVDLNEAGHFQWLHAAGTAPMSTLAPILQSQRSRRRLAKEVAVIDRAVLGFEPSIQVLRTRRTPRRLPILEWARRAVP